MSNSVLRQRLSYVYALITGILGMLILLRLFMRQTAPIDLVTLLTFALTAIILTRFRIPIGSREDLLGLDGAVLLGAALAGGPALGGWAAFITGLVANMLLDPLHLHARPLRWPENAAMALLDGGRNVIATVVAWAAYTGLRGSMAPQVPDATQAVAMIVFFVTYALVRIIWLWPVSLPSRPGRPGALTLDSLIIELVPLPAAVLAAATLVRLGWSFFLLLAGVFIGTGVLMRQLFESLRAAQERVSLLETADQIRRQIATTPAEAGTLGEMAYQVIAAAASVDRFEMGFYDSTYTQIHIQFAIDGQTRLPAMHIPFTVSWEWLSQRTEPWLAADPIQLAQLPFTLPPLDGGRAPKSAMFVPIVVRPSEELPNAVGGIIVQSRQSHGLNAQDLARAALLAEQIGAVLHQEDE